MSVASEVTSTKLGPLALKVARWVGTVAGVQLPALLKLVPGPFQVAEVKDALEALAPKKSSFKFYAYNAALHSLDNAPHGSGDAAIRDIVEFLKEVK